MTEDSKEYLTLDEAAAAVGIKRASLYYYLDRLGIKRHKFPFNRHMYIAAADVARIKVVKESPWKSGGEKGEDKVA